MEKVKAKSSFFRKFVGDKKFYLMVLSIAVPIMIQNGITNFVSLLDNIMIGRIGTEQMSGAAIVTLTTQINTLSNRNVMIVFPPERKVKYVACRNAFWGIKNAVIIIRYFARVRASALVL